VTPSAAGDTPSAVDFYILRDPTPRGRLRFACRLVEKAFSAGHRIYLHCHDEMSVQQLDDELWRFRQGSFLPHQSSLNGTDPETPIHIGCDDRVGPHYDLLINLSDSTPPEAARYRRLAELVSGSEASKAAARQRYRAWREAGWPLRNHDIEMTS